MYIIDSLAEDNRRSAHREWRKRRLANIRANVSAADVLVRFGVELHRGGTQPEQISCPFHGTDSSPSAKYFPEEDDSLSGVWCFVCHERWDVIKLWKKFSGTENFSEILRQIEREFGLTVPEANTVPEPEPEPDPLVDEVKQLFSFAEQRLREYRDCFTLQSHLKLGQLLDYTYSHVERKQISLATAKDRLTAVHAKIKKVRRPRATALADPEC
jgi:hypothetical protein